MCDRAERRLAEPRPHVAELRPSERDEEDRRLAAPAGEVLDEVEERRLAPVHVVEDDHQRALRRQRFEEPPYGPEGLLGGDWAALAEDGGDPVAHARVLVGDRLEGPVPPSRSTSATGRNVAPSVAGSQWPRRMRASSSSPLASSCDRRVLPTPGEATTVTRRVSRAATAASNAARSRASSSSRPTSGADIRSSRRRSGRKPSTSR